MTGGLERLEAALADRYRIVRNLGEGGMATVYLAEDLKHDRQVAVKVLRPELAAVLGVERFVQEIRTTANLQHPHILPLFDSGEAASFLYYVMPYIEGETLRDKLNREKQLSIGEALAITSEVADALDYAHRHGVIHRDVKPENILLREGRAMVADFGIALSVAMHPERLTEIGITLGTPAYMSPEQVGAERRLDARADQYALACVLYEMLSGDPPFVASTAQAVLARHLRDSAPPIDTVRPDVSPAIAGALAQGLAKVPADRHASVRAFCNALSSTAVATARGLPSVAVLPFVNMSADPDQDYFADGMAEELINALTKVPGLRVIARMSAFAFKGTTTDVETIGERLNVARVVEGSVRRMGTKLRVTVQLIEVDGGRQLWSDRYDRALDDLFEIQDDIARRIVETITPKLLGERESALVTRPTHNQEAYDLYLRAGEHLARLSSAETRKAIAKLEHATALDGSFAGAWARLSGACCLMDGWFEHDQRWRDQTDHALTRALELDPENAEAHMVRGRVLWTPRHQFRHREALRALEQSLRLQPGSPVARLWRSLILMHVGLMAEAEEGLEEVLAADPSDATSLQFMAQCKLFQFRVDEAAEYQERALSTDPGHHFAQIFQPTVLLYQGDLAGAESALSVARKLLKDDPLLDGNDALLWAKRGEQERALAASARAMADRRSVAHRHHSWHYAAAAHALLGQPSQAIGLLRSAAGAGFPNYLVFRDDPHLDALRTDPDMTVLLRDLEDSATSYRAEFGQG